jgi:hypothetical protein
MNLFAPIENVHVYSNENLKNIHVYLTEKLFHSHYFYYKTIINGHKKKKKYGPNLFLVGDLNSKTPSLGCRALVSDSNGKVLEEILSTDSELVVLNDESPTYFRFKSDYTEILDLFIVLRI